MHLFKKIIRRFGKYELVSFFTGFVLLSFELIASRLLAPSVGTSTYVWTSVIGIIIAALALGFAVGGYIADKRAAQSDLPLILLLAAVSIGGTLFFSPAVLQGLESTVTDARLRGVLASIILFLPTSFAIGVSSPYLARLRNKSVETTGRSVALLDASNSIGGIAGTFLTGFVLISLLGLRISLLLLVVILICINWLLVPRQNSKMRLWLTAASLFLCLSPQTILDRSVKTDIDTPTAHYQIKAIIYGERAVTAISTGPGGLQSGVYTDGSKDLVFSYTRAIAALTRQAPAKQNILIIGGGAFTLPEHLAAQYPNSSVDTVEIDPELQTIARRYFNFNQPANLTIINQDARTFLNNAQKKYDVIIVDAYNDDVVPPSLLTAEYASSLKAAASNDAIILVNMIAGSGSKCAELFNTIHHVYADRFKESRYFPLASLNYDVRQNIIGLYSARALNWAPLDEPQPRFSSVTAPTDDKSSVEQLSLRCSS